MTDGRHLLAELQESGLAEPGLDYDTVMAELAAGQDWITVLLAPGPTARSAYSSRLVRTTHRQSALIDELADLARAPYRAMPAPLEPVVPVHRLSDDLLRTAGRRLEVRWRWERYPDHGHWVSEVLLDDTVHGGGDLPDGSGPEEQLALLSDRLCEAFLHEEIWGGWPLCPRHPSRPMWAVLDESGAAVWRCEADAADEVPIGRLGLGIAADGS